MCGIGGILAPNGAKRDHVAASQIARQLAHRGPDGQGFLSWSDEHGASSAHVATELPVGSLWFAHRRLAIIDLSDGGWQPMRSRNGRFHIVFNGEIYNYRELRQDLQDQGTSFRSHSDTEVLLEGFSRWGTNILPRLTGMFAFAILDTRERSLLLARDPFGIKPLYYTHLSDGTLAFASEIGALLSLPGVDRTADAKSVYHYLRFGQTDRGTDTLLRSIKAVPAASSIRIDIASRQMADATVYWAVNPAESNRPSNRSQAAEHLRELFLDSVKLHLRSDVPIAVELSGGIDSSAICAATRHLEPHGELQTFTYAAGSPETNEERWSDLVAAGVKSRVHKIRVDAAVPMGDLEQLARSFDQPVATTSMYAQYRVYEHVAAHGLKVSLSGQGADELLAGYPTFRIARVASLIRQGQWHRACRLLWNIIATPRLDPPLRELARLATWTMPGSLQKVGRSLLGEALVPRWLNGEWLRAQGVVTAQATRPKEIEALRALLIETLTETSLPALLRYADRSSMAFSVESRVPFLTPALADFVLGLPEEWILPVSGRTKDIFRTAMRGLVPDPILNRRDKIGFVTPERDWMVRKRDRVSEILSDHAVPALRQHAARDEWLAITNGKRRYGAHVWRWINILLWTDAYGITFPQ